MRSLLGSGSSDRAGLDLKSTRLGGVVSTPADLDLVLMGLEMQIRYSSALRWHLGVLADGHVLLALIHGSMYLSVHSLISATLSYTTCRPQWHEDAFVFMCASVCRMPA